MTHAVPGMLKTESFVRLAWYQSLWQAKGNTMLQNDSADEYVVDDEGRIRPVHQMGWAKERWNDASSFDEAMMGVATLAMSDAFPADGCSRRIEVFWSEHEK